MEHSLSGNRVLSVVNDEPFWKLMKAESSSSGEQLWFSILHERFSQKSELVDSFFRIADKSIGLKHPNITPVLRSDTEESLHFIVMEPFSGEPLSSFIKKNGPLGEHQARAVAVQLCQALQYAKLSGTMHGCLTADSIFINSDLEISIINFGCDEFVETALPLLEQDEAIRYARHMSPDWTGNDLYSIGTILYFMLTGAHAYHDENLDGLVVSQRERIPLVRARNKNISQEMEDFIIRLLGHDPQRPFHSATELVRLLAPETVRKDALPDPSVVDEPLTVREKLQKYLDRLPPVFGELIPTWVGVKRRVAVTFVTVFVMVMMAILLILLSRENISETAEVEAYYLDNISQRDSASKEFLALEPNTEDQPPEPVVSVEEPSEQLPDEDQFVETELGENLTPVPLVDELSRNTEPQPLEEETVRRPQVAPLDFIGSEFRIHVQVGGMPVQADVFVGQEKVGSTNPQGDLLLAMAQPGSTINLRIEKPGFQSWQKSVKIDETNRFGLAVTLLPEPTALRRFTLKKVGFADRVIIDNKLPSFKLPASVDLQPGPHLFRYIESSSMFTLDTTIFLGMEDKPEVYIDAASLGSGTLSVIVQDAYRVGYAYVSLNGEEKLETTPFRRQVPAGQHQIILFREGYTATPQDTTVIVLPNRETVVRCRLVKIP